MGDFTFVWQGTGSLAAQLMAGIARLSGTVAAHGRPDSITLWHVDGLGLRIQSKMYDIGERREVGVLQFTAVREGKPGDLNVVIPAVFRSPLKISKLVVSEAGVTAESGVTLVASNGQEIVIVAGAYPFTLAISGIASVPHVFEPEHALEAYRRVPII